MAGISTHQHLLTTGGFIKAPFTAKNEKNEKIRLYQLTSFDAQIITTAQEAIHQEVKTKQREYTNTFETFDEDIHGTPYLLKEGKTLQLISNIEAAKLNLQYGRFDSQQSAARALERIASGSSPQAAEAMQALTECLLNCKCSVHQYAIAPLKELKLPSYEVVKGLEAFLIASSYTCSHRHGVAEILESIALGEGPQASEALESLAVVLFDPKKNWGKKEAAESLIKIASTCNCPLSSEAIKKIQLALTTFYQYEFALTSVTDALYSWVIFTDCRTNEDFLYPTEIMNGLIFRLYHPDTEPLDRYDLIEILGRIANKNTPQASEAIKGIVFSFTHPNNQVDEKRVANEFVSYITSKNTPQASELIKELTACLAHPKTYSWTKHSISKTLSEIALDGKTIANEAIKGLMIYLNDSENDDFIKSTIVEILGKIACKNDHRATEAIKTLTACLGNGKNNEYSRGYAAEALGEVAAKGRPLPLETFKRLSACLFDPKSDDYSKSPIAYALAKIATEKDAALPEKLLQWLANCLLDTQNNYYSRKSVLRWLHEKNSYASSQNKSPPSSFFHLVATLGDIEIGEYLIQIAPEETYSVNAEGLSPLDIAKLNGKEEFARWLTSVNNKETQEAGCVLM